MSAKTLLLAALAVAALSAPVAAMAYDDGYGDRQQADSPRDQRDGDHRIADRGEPRHIGQRDQAWGYQNHERGHAGRHGGRDQDLYGYDR
jgi:Ni/Co efflux regulator RcnB